jgi:putative (di)nucleoside polyphosphate hydrolase
MRSERFRLGVGAVIRRADGLVLALERSDVPGAWQFVQGGVKRSENLRDALFREVREETGLNRSSFGAVHEVPVLLGYELPKSARRKRTRGQVHQWFFLDFTGRDGAIHLEPGGEFTRFKWTPIADVIKRVVAFRRAVYRELGRWAVELPPAAKRGHR